MADNVPITAGAGTDIATDQVPGTLEHVQLFKLAYSADGSRVLVQADVNGVLVQIASLPLPAGAATAAKQDTGNTSLASLDVALSTRLKAADTLAAVTSITNVVHVDDNAASLTVDGTVTTAPPANASTNVAQLAGTATSVNSGTKDAGTLRVVMATDQPALTNKLLVTPDSVALPANQSVNVNQMAGVTPSLNTGVRDAGTQRVTVATNDLVPISAASLPLPAGASLEATQLLQATAALQTTGNASLVSIDADTNALTTVQGAASAAVVGPLVQALVSDTPESYLVDTIRPLSITTEGRLRVSSRPADIDQVWIHTFDNPWDADDAWTDLPSAGSTSFAHAGVTHV